MNANRSLQEAKSGRLRAVIYMRTAHRDDAQLSVDMQRDVCQRFIQERGWQLVGDEVDASTGGDMDRPGLQRMLAMAWQRTIDAVVVVRFDRLSAEERTLREIIDSLDAQRVRVATVDGLDTGTPEGRFLSHIFGFMRSEGVPINTQAPRRHRRSKRSDKLEEAKQADATAGAETPLETNHLVNGLDEGNRV